MESLLVALPMVLPAMMLVLARRLPQGRIRRHPDHEHGVVLATRYLVLSYLVCFGLPVLLQALLLGGSWAPVVALAVATMGSAAMVMRPGEGRDSDVETWAHLIFGGLTGTLVVASLVVVGRLGTMAMGLGSLAVGTTPAVVVLLTVLVQSMAFVPFCTPFVRSQGVRPRRLLPAVPDLDGLTDMADLGQALHTDEAPL